MVYIHPDKSELERYAPSRRELLAALLGLGTMASGLLSACGGTVADMPAQPTVAVTKALVLAAGPYGQLSRDWREHYALTLTRESGEVIRYGGTPDLLNCPLRAVCAKDGSFWVADRGNARVIHLGASLQYLGSIDTVAGVRMRAPRGVALLDNNWLAVADTSLNQIAIFQPDGTGIWIGKDELAAVIVGWRPHWDTETDPALLSTPSAVAMAPDGTVVVLDTSAKRLALFKASGDAIESIRLEGRPTGLAISPDGVFYVCDPEARTVSAFYANSPNSKLTLALPAAATPCLLSWQASTTPGGDRLLVSSTT
jgi:DNA-binding beta-propeller fold protein YncE